MIPPIKNKRVQAHKDEFTNLVDTNKDKMWYVCSHDNPDPDSLASALGMQTILQFLGVENVSMIKLGNTSWAITAVNDSISSYYNNSITNLYLLAPLDSPVYTKSFTATSLIETEH